MHTLYVRCRVKHFLHTRTSLWPLMGDYHNVTLLNLSAKDSLASIVLGIEDNGRAGEFPYRLVNAGGFHYTTVLRNVAEEYSHASVFSVGMFDVADTTVGTVGVKRRICGVLGTKLVAEPSGWRT